MDEFSPVTELRRRTFLQSVCGACGGLSLADLLSLRAQAATPGTPADTAVIFVTLGGGASQFETYDPKPEAPVEYRGAFDPIATSVPGVKFCELLPRQATLMDQLAIVRSIHHEQASHIALHIIETGYDLRSSANALKGEMPSLGAVASRVRGNSSDIPANISLPRLHAYSGAQWLGAEHHAFAVNDDPNAADFHVSNLALLQGLNVDRLSDRRKLLQEIDCEKRAFEHSGVADSLNAFSQQAFNLVTGERAQRAFDINQENSQTRDLYGRNSFGQRLLLARRLVEADVPFVTVRMGDWDDHLQLPQRMSKRVPEYDVGLAALIEDLRERGLQRRVLVVAMGEFGRTPRVNPNAGRDHYPAVNCALLAGGSYKMGQVIGATDDKAATVTAAPYRPQSVLAMVYRHLGIDPASTFPDYSGRPRYVLEERTEITELL